MVRKHCLIFLTHSKAKYKRTETSSQQQCQFGGEKCEGWKSENESGTVLYI